MGRTDYAVTNLNLSTKLTILTKSLTNGQICMVCKQDNIWCTRAGGTGPAAPVLARPIFQAPTKHLN